jgi:hypothetical protein
MSSAPGAADQPGRLGRPGVARPRTGAMRMRRALALAGCGVLSVALGACESTEQESARIGRENEAATHTAARTAPHSSGARRERGSSRAHARGSAHAQPGKAPSVKGAKSP